MTGRQDHPGTGATLGGEQTFQVNYADLCRALGVRDVRVVNPLDLEETRTQIKEAVDNPEPSVVICQAACSLIQTEERPTFEIDPAECNECGVCLRTGCPAIQQTEDGIEVDPLLCHGCGVCQQVCRFGAIRFREQP